MGHKGTALPSVPCNRIPFPARPIANVAGATFPLKGRERVAFAGRCLACKEVFCIYTILVTITYDAEKRAKGLAERGLDFANARYVFEGTTLEVEDVRRDYGETRVICYGLLEGRMVVVGYTPRGADRHVFSMRKANEREQSRIGPKTGL